MRKFLNFLIFIFLLQSTSVSSQQIEVTGKVTDEDNIGIPGANIVISGTTVGTITDNNGNYSISVSGGDDILRFSYLGYLTQEITVGEKSIINVSLMTDITDLEEVVVVGYGTVRKIDLTNSVASVKADDIPINATTSVGQMLQGRAAGLTLTSVSAQPGSRLNINIRGGTNPLYVVDGVPILTNPNPKNTSGNTRTTDPGIMLANLGYGGGVDRDPLNSINPSDIESIDILKDASAAAIYGSAAADGVILITTKKGKAGKVKVEYRGSYTSQTPQEYFQLMNAEDFMIQHNRFELEQAKITTKTDIYGSGSLPNIPLFFSETDIAEAGEGTDWLDVLMRNGFIHEQNISLSGGSEYSTLFASFNLYDNAAIIENSTFKRYSGRINFDQEIGKRIKAGANVTFSQINANNASTGDNQGGPEKFNMLQTAYAYSPTTPIYDSLGRYAKTYDPKITNPAAFLDINDISRNMRFMANPKLEISILKDLNLNLVGGIDRSTNNRNFYLPRTARNVQLPNGMAQLLTGRIDNYSSEGYLTYNRENSNSYLTIVGGAGYYKTLNEGFGFQAVDFFTDAFEYHRAVIASDPEASLLNSYKEERIKISQFFRVNYSLYNKYIVTLVGRNDASSIFAENKKSGFFPGVSVAWKINEETFMGNVPVLSELKLRAGYGTAGNEGYIGNNPWQLYSTGYPFLIGTTLYPGVALSQLENPDLTWETDVTTNIGLDIGLLENRITSNLDFFIKLKKDLLSYNPLPNDAPIGRIAANVGTQKSQGFELAINTFNLTGEFKWKTNIRLSTYTLNWETRNPQVALAPWIKEKDPVLALYGWETDGLLTSTEDTTGYVTNMSARPVFGNIKYVDQNNDGLLDENDVVLLADRTPKWSFGFNNTFNYKGFDLNIYIYGLLGRELQNGYTSFLSPVGISDAIYPSNTIIEIQDVWSSDNPEGIYPGLSESSNPYNGSNPSSNEYPYNSITNDFWLVDGSFARLKNIALGYTLPNKLINKTPISSLRVYIDLQNLYVFTKYKGIDPEISDINPYPQVFSKTFGLNITF
ncbi:SusC/RagA family TonB-linked outer membrane protein [Bacteroidota bacterium]